MWKGLTAVAVMLTLGVFLVAADKQSAAQVGAKAPLFSLPDQTGKTVNLADYSGKLVVLEWWNNECPVVQRHYKDNAMNNLAKKYMDKDVVWLAINSTSNKTTEDNKSAATQMNMDRPVLSDASGDVGHMYGATNTPGMYVIDKEGNLAYMGAIDDNPSGKKASAKNYVSQALDELMAGQTVSEPKTKQYGCSIKYAK
jgi:peroxiredoxin